VYDHLRCVHEVDEALKANIFIHDFFDSNRWMEASFKKVDIKENKCTPVDKVMLTSLIAEGRRFTKLDKCFFNFRGRSQERS